MAIAFWFGLWAPPLTFLRRRMFLNGRFRWLFRAIFKNIQKYMAWLQKINKFALIWCDIGLSRRSCIGYSPPQSRSGRAHGLPCFQKLVCPTTHWTGFPPRLRQAEDWPYLFARVKAGGLTAMARGVAVCSHRLHMRQCVYPGSNCLHLRLL